MCGVLRRSGGGARMGDEWGLVVRSGVHGQIWGPDGGVRAVLLCRGVMWVSAERDASCDEDG
jgi:hypothetical protein